MTLSRAVEERCALARRTGYSYVFSCTGLILVAGLLIAALVAAAADAPGSIQAPDSQLTDDTTERRLPWTPVTGRKDA